MSMHEWNQLYSKEKAQAISKVVCTQRPCVEATMFKVLNLAMCVCFCVQVHYILQEVVMGGMVLETNMNEIVAQVEVQNRMEKSEVSLPS